MAKSSFNSPKVHLTIAENFDQVSLSKKHLRIMFLFAPHVAYHISQGHNVIFC